MQIEGINAVVTGGASGLGLATARRLVAGGATVTLVDLPSSDGIGLAKEIGDAAQFMPADVTNADDINAALDLAESVGPIRALVHCAGRGGDRLRIIDRDRKPGEYETFEEVIRINLMGTYNVLRLTAARMAGNEILDGDRGAVVMTSSVAAFDGQIGQTSYTASKSAVAGITLPAARDLASWQIRVNTIAPGTFDTAMLARLRDDIREGLAANIPHPKRLGDADDYGHLAVSLIENPFINGETIRLDGALRMAPR